MAVAGARLDPNDTRGRAADLYARHARHLYRFCLSQLRNRSEAEDAVQTTFLQAFRALQRGTIPNIERAWLIAIAQNVCRDIQRSSARRRDSEVDADPELVAPAVDPDHRIRERISELEGALARIPANQRRALVLHAWQGLRYREIAGMMGVSETAVEMLAFRARRSLSQALSTGPSRVRQALDVGGILTAVRSLLSLGSGASAVAGAGVAGLALATLGASPIPVRHDAHIVRPAPALVRPALTATTHVVRAAPHVRRGAPSAHLSRMSVVPGSLPTVTENEPTASASSPAATRKQNTGPTVTTVVVSPAATSPTPPLPITAPSLPVSPTVTVPQLPALPVATPTVSTPTVSVPTP